MGAPLDRAPSRNRLGALSVWRFVGGCIKYAYTMHHGVCMRTTMNLDDELLERAAELAPDARNRTELIHEALRALIHLRASRALAAAAGSARGQAKAPPRRRVSVDGPG